LFNAISSATAYTNSDLKEIIKLTKIKKSISFHTARHTFATTALQKGMRIEYVSKYMGHSDIKETQIYAKIINQELDKAIEIFN
jgi:integrase/recombinase XerD